MGCGGKLGLWVRRRRILCCDSLNGRARVGYWVECSGAFQAGAGVTNLATVGCLRERSGVWSGGGGGWRLQKETEREREREREESVVVMAVVERRWGAPEMMTHNKPSSLN